LKSSFFSGSTGSFQGGSGLKSPVFFRSGFARLNREFSGQFRLNCSGFPGSTGKYPGGYSGFIRFRLNRVLIPAQAFVFMFLA